jgi:hypothetical protein
MEEYKDNFPSPTEVLLHCQVKHSINITPGAPLPNGPIYFLTSNQAPQPVEAQLYLCGRNMGPNDYVLTTRPKQNKSYKSIPNSLN